MNPSNLKPLLLLIAMFFVSGIEANQAEVEQKVMAFVTAFNEKDVDAMLALATENITWMSISGEKLAAEASGSASLKAAMQNYFSSHPHSYSKIKQIHSSESWVTTLEQAGRDIDGQFKGQCAYAMYQLKNGLIESVWYFPAHSCDLE